MATPTTLRYQWQATSGTTALSTTTATLLIAGQTQTDLTGGTRQLRNYLTDLSLINLNGTVSTLVSILDGSTVIWTGHCADKIISMLITLVTLKRPMRILTHLKHHGLGIKTKTLDQNLAGAVPTKSVQINRHSFRELLDI